MIKKALFLLRGAASFLPQANRVYYKKTGGTCSSRYCYSVWLRHLILNSDLGMLRIPNRIVEIGPGDSLGTGFAGLLSGATEYFAFDIVKHFSIDRNIRIFKEILQLFENRERIPDDREFPRLKPLLKSYDFPSHILTEKHLAFALEPERVERIKNAVLHMDKLVGEFSINFCSRWLDNPCVAEETIDMIYSQAAMEYLDDLERAYEKMYKLLRAGGVMSHEIDFGCHGTASKWNGHWGYSEHTWKIIKGKQTCFISREPCSAHINTIKKNKFNILLNSRVVDRSGIGRKQLTEKMRDMTEDDLITRGAFIIARK